MAGNTNKPYASTAQSDAAPQDQPRRKFPLPQYSPEYERAYQFDQEISQILKTNFPPAVLNTKSSNATFGLGDANAILTAFSQPQPYGAGLGKYLATFTRVPASWDDFKTMPFTYPGFPGAIGQNNVRDVFTQKVNVRLRYDYFVVDPTGIAVGALDSGGTAINTVISEGAIPSINKKYFLVVFNGSAIQGDRTNSIVKAGGVTAGGATYLQTLPQLATYLQWITNAAPYVNGTAPSGWSNTTPPIWNGVTDNGAAATEGQIVMDDSTLIPHAGNIIARVTPYVLIR